MNPFLSSYAGEALSSWNLTNITKRRHGYVKRVIRDAQNSPATSNEISHFRLQFYRDELMQIRVAYEMSLSLSLIAIAALRDERAPIAIDTAFSVARAKATITTPTDAYLAAVSLRLDRGFSAREAIKDAVRPVFAETGYYFFTPGANLDRIRSMAKDVATFGGVLREAISACDVYQMIRPAQDYDDWFEERIQIYELEEDDDYVIGGFGNENEYFVSADVARFLLIAERSLKDARAMFSEMDREIAQEKLQ